MRPRADILVIKLSALGDFVLAMPAFARIRAAHPNAPITLLTTPLYAELAKVSPYFDRVWTDGRPTSLRGWLSLIRRMRRARFARVYDLQTNDRTQLMLQALQPLAPAWSGTAFGASLPDRTPDRMAMHSLERHAEPAPLGGNLGRRPDRARRRAAARPELADRAVAVRGDRLALLIPGSAPHRLAKRWPVQRYGIPWRPSWSRRGTRSRSWGAGRGRPGRSDPRISPAARDLTGRTSFGDIARLGARAALAIGNDTGPTHLVAAAGAPTVVLFSADSNPAQSAPRGRVTVLAPRRSRRSRHSARPKRGDEPRRPAAFAADRGRVTLNRGPQRSI